ncbi:lantibiotic dehydratase [Streptomyces xanthophaeus]|uniref:lantibiotic dehydratase n=1 Tax=Streptomyces xanthophaeus TaxID=67385 RepID=UPI00368D55B2
MNDLEILPLFVLRGAGFPVTDTLLPAAGTAHADIARARSLLTRLDALHPALLSLLADQPLERPERRRLRRRLASRTAADPALPPGTPAAASVARWNALVAELDDTRARAARGCTAELDAAQEYLRAWHARPRAAEAVWFSSHSAASGLEAYARGTQLSGTTRRVALRYLQRLATKNETTSFFGPFQYGEVPAQDTAPGPAPGAPMLVFDPASPRHGAHTTFLARYVVEGLAQRIGQECAGSDRTPLSLHPLARVHDRGLRVADRDIALPAPLLRVLRTGPVVPADLPPSLRSAVAKLARAGLLRPRLAPASTSLTEQADLRAAVAGLREAAPEPVTAWLERLDTIEESVERVRSSGWPERRTEAAGLAALLDGYGLGAADRPTGSLYADRQPVYEECVGGLRGLGLDRRALAPSQDALHTVLRVHAAYAARVREDAASWLRLHWEKTGLPARTGLYDLLEGLQQYPQPDYRDGSPAADALWERLDAVAPAGSCRVEVTARQLAAVFSDVLPDEPFVCSPDLMVRRTPAGTDQLVVGEIHHGIQPWSWLARALPEERRRALRGTVGTWAAELARHQAGEDAVPVTLVEPRFTGKTFTLEYPGLALERMGRSALPRDQVLGLHDVIVDRDPLALRTTDGVPLALMPTSPVGPLSRALGGLALWGPRTPPLREHRPRVTVGGVVWFRETWRLGADALAGLTAARTPEAALTEAHRLRDHLGMPRFVYVKPDGEPKPVFVDLESVAYCDMLARLAAGSAGAVVSEMLPGPDEQVLHCAEGTFTSELRTAVLVRNPS